MVKKIKKRKISKENKKSSVHREFLTKLKDSQPIASYSFTTKMFKCKFCNWEFYPWELPRHLENAHSPHLPPSANWRKKVIPDWNDEFENEYRANLLKPIIYEVTEFDQENVPIKKIEKTAKDIQRKDLEASRDR